MLAPDLFLARISDQKRAIIGYLVIQKMLRQFLVYGLLLTSLPVVAEPVFLIATHEDRGIYLELQSVHHLDSARVGFSLKVISDGYLPKGASEKVGIALTDYVMDCRWNRWEEKETRYMSDENRDVGHAPSATHPWKNVESGSDFEIVRKQVCTAD